MFGALEDSEIKKVLDNNVLGRIGFCENNLPYILPISYVYANGAIYCRSNEGLKLRIMRSNPSVCFEVEELSDISNWRSVLVQGEFEEIADPEERSAALGYLTGRDVPTISSVNAQLSSLWPFVPDNLNDIQGIVFRIKIKEMSGRFEKYSQTPTAH
jgi:nitroimidazol reductase NimA-like FMN-containing flavoprotein (pyridoxamine 5'-phosphate oxidase superfamily)